MWGRQEVGGREIERVTMEDSPRLVWSFLSVSSRHSEGRGRCRGAWLLWSPNLSESHRPQNRTTKSSFVERDSKGDKARWPYLEPVTRARRGDYHVAVHWMEINQAAAADERRGREGERREQMRGEAEGVDLQILIRCESVETSGCLNELSRCKRGNVRGEEGADMFNLFRGDRALDGVRRAGLPLCDMNRHFHSLRW
jgi:hypothetical protein